MTRRRLALSMCASLAFGVVVEDANTTAPSPPAQVRYVAPWGSDSNIGSIEYPWRTPAKAGAWIASMPGTPMRVEVREW